LIAKYTFEKVVYAHDIEDKWGEQYIDLSGFYIFFEAISIFDGVILCLMSISVIKYTFFWIPQLSFITEALQLYFNKTIKRLLLFVLLTVLIFSVFFSFFNANVAYGFYNFWYVLVRTCVMGLEGNLFEYHEIYLV